MTPRSAPLLSVILVTWNGWAHLNRCLESLMPALAGISHDVWVVDNASTDETLSALAHQWPAVNVLPLERNAGFSAGANRGAARAQGEFLWLLNPDTRVPVGAPACLLAALQARPQAGLAAPRLRRPDGASDPLSARRYPTAWSDLLEKAGLRRLSARLTRLPLEGEACRPVPLVSGAAPLIRRSAWLAVGGLDEGYLLYAEDMALCRQLQAAGWETLYCGAAEVVHVGGGCSAGCAEWAGVQALLSMQRYLRRHHGPRTADLHRAGLRLLSVLKRGLFLLLAHTARTPARRQAAAHKAGLHAHILAALGRENRHA